MLPTVFNDFETKTNKNTHMTNTEYFFQYSLPFAKQSGIFTYKGIYALSLSEENFKNALGVFTNRELCDCIFDLENSGKMYITATVSDADTSYDIYITKQGMLV